MPRTLPTLLLALLALAVGASVAGADPSGAQLASTRQDRAALRRERVAVRLINDAIKHIEHAHRDCRRTYDSDARPTLTDASPSADLLGALGVLRRPATEADRIDPDSLSFPFARGIFANFVRVATAADGRQFFVIVAQDRVRSSPLPRHCLALQNEELQHLLTNRTPAVGRLATRLKARLDRQENPKGGFRAAEAIFLFDRTADGRLGGGGGGVDLRWFLRHGMFGSSGAGDTSDVSGLLPDGVASVDLTFAKAVSRGPHRDPQTYPKTIKLTVPVRDNVVSFRVARPAYDAFPTLMVWRRADGSAMRRIGRAPARDGR